MSTLADTSAADGVDLDISARLFWHKPYEERERSFAWLRANRPVSFHRPYESELLPVTEETAGFYAIVKHDDIKRVSRDSQTFASGEGILVEDFPEVVAVASQSFLAMDDPEHHALRSIISKAFTPNRIRSLEQMIAGNVTDLLDQMEAGDGGDLCHLFAKHLPARIFADFFGITNPEQRATVIDAAERMLAWDDPEAAAGRDALTTYAEEADRLSDVAYALIDERLAQPGNDLMSWIVEADFDGRRMEEWEAAAFFVLLSAAANDTTRHSTAHAVRLLSENPSARAWFMKDVAGRSAAVVEEVLRHSTPVMQFRRTTTVDTEVRGVSIPSGSKVVMWYCSGNRDEDVFDEPARFDPTRAKTDHLGFGGGGAHFCIGASLGRTMLREALVQLYTRFPNLQSGPAHFMVGNFMHGVHQLPVTW
jgi:cytochrome P450